LEPASACARRPGDPALAARRKAGLPQTPREPPRKVNCMYEWSSLPLPRLGSVRSVSLGITRS